MDHLLCVCVFLPLGGALLLAVLPRKRDRWLKRTALSFSLVELLLALALCWRFDSGIAGMHYVERYEWVAALGIYFHIGVDGFSLPLVALTAFLAPLALLASWKSAADMAKGVAVAVLTATTAIIGALAAVDLFLFYAFFEFSLLPLSLLVCGWGGERRVHAAVKFVLHSLAGSLPLLIAIVYLANYHREAVGAVSFDLLALRDLVIPLAAQKWLFLAFFFGFAVRMPLVPLHTWLPHIQVQAPSAGSVLLAGAWLNVGAYGLARFCLTLFPEAFCAFQDYVAGLAILSVFYGGLLALAQTDLKRLIACVSVSQMGLVLLGICTLNAQGLQGSAVQMISHGLGATALLLAAGMLQERRGDLDIGKRSGLARGMPALAACLLVAMLATAGLPGLSGFVGTFLILLGAHQTFGPGALLVALGVVLTAAGLLRLFQRTVWGNKEDKEEGEKRTLERREMTVLLPPILCLICIGLYPFPLLKMVEMPVEQMLVRIDAERCAALDAETEEEMVEEGDLEEGDLEEGDLEEGDLEEGDLEEGGLEEGDLEEGGLEEGDLEEGDLEEGGLEEGDLEEGDLEEGGLEEGDLEEGGLEEGDPGSGTEDKRSEL